jgi:hypothetical protein
VQVAAGGGQRLERGLVGVAAAPAGSARATDPGSRERSATLTEMAMSQR